MPATVVEANKPVVLFHKPLIGSSLWKRLTSRILKDREFLHHFGEKPEGEQKQWAERIMNEALGFLSLCAMDRTNRYSPSPLVDIGWHTFILYTKSYTDFCQEMMGGYIHHEPSDVSGVEYPRGRKKATVVALQEHGILLDLELWSSEASCGRCGGGKVKKNGCDSCVSGDCDSHCGGLCD